VRCGVVEPRSHPNPYTSEGQSMSEIKDAADQKWIQNKSATEIHLSDFHPAAHMTPEQAKFTMRSMAADLMCDLMTLEATSNALGDIVTAEAAHSMYQIVKRLRDYLSDEF